MSTARSLAAYRDIKAKRLEQAQIKAYGMVPINARFPGKCGCKHDWPVVRGWEGQTNPCQFAHGDKIVKFRGAWWNATCVDRVKQEEFRASARFVQEQASNRRDGTVRWDATRWTNDPAEAAQWAAVLCEDERVTERTPTNA